MFKPLSALCGTYETACAAHIDLALFRHRLAAAFGAMIGEVEGIALHLGREVIHKLWNNIARTLDHHAVARAHAQPRDLVPVVQRHIGDCDAADQHRGQPAHGCQLAGTADLTYLSKALGAYWAGA